MIAVVVLWGGVGSDQAVHAISKPADLARRDDCWREYCYCGLASVKLC
jgi:hypothetical protein